MPDPFTFDPARVVFKSSPGFGLVYYETPSGTLEEAITELDLAMGASMLGSMNAGALMAHTRLAREFERTVASLSSHQRLTWLAAANKENTDV